jgi:hypothetical protein
MSDHFQTNTERDLAKSDLNTGVIWRRCVVRYTGSNSASTVTCFKYSGYIHKNFLLGLYLLPQMCRNLNPPPPPETVPIRYTTSRRIVWVHVVRVQIFDNLQLKIHIFLHLNTSYCTQAEPVARMQHFAFDTALWCKLYTSYQLNAQISLSI